MGLQVTVTTHKSWHLLYNKGMKNSVCSVARTNLGIQNVLVLSYIPFILSIKERNIYCQPKPFSQM